MINNVIKADELSDLAEWKGFKSLSYTFIYTSEQHTKTKIVITFIKKDKNMKIITVMNEKEMDSMDFRVSEDDELSHKMMELRNRLRDSYNS